MSLAKSYAKALLDAPLVGRADTTLGADNQQWVQVEAQLRGFVEAMRQSDRLFALLCGPVLSRKDRVNLTGAVATKMNAGPDAQRFLALLAQKSRLAHLAATLDAAVEIRLLREGGILGKVEAADPLSQQDLSELEKAFQSHFRRTVKLKSVVDPSLLAGVRVTVGGSTFDGTLKAQLGQLKAQLLSASAVIH